MMRKKELWVILLLLGLLLTGCGAQENQIKVKNAEIPDAILYTLEDGRLQYDVFCYGSISGAVIADETGSGINSAEDLATLLGTADAPAPVAGCSPEGRTLGKAVTADLTTDSRGNSTKIRIRSVTDRPVIGISWKSDSIGEDYQNFAEALERNGALAVYLSLVIAPEHAQMVLEGLDGLFVTGGEDWNPALYGQSPVPHGSVDCNDIRDASDLYLIREALAADLPMLCICRGAQGLNIALGGGLIQDVPSYLARQTVDPARATPVPDGCSCGENHLRIQVDGITHHGNTYHPLAHIDPGSRWLYDIFGDVSLDAVSTAHHQAIDPERLGAGLTVAATAGDGIIEAVEYRENRFVLGLQWHPERDALADSQNTGIDRRNSNRPLRALVEHAAIK